MTENTLASSNNGQSVSVIMPSLNEELAVKKMVTAIQQELPNAEIILVDSSTDQTAEIAESLGCIIKKLLPATGNDAALLAGFKIASRAFVVTLDCDDTYPVKSIKSLLAKIDEGYDVVSASRLGTRPKAMPFANYLANRTFVLMTKIICRAHSTDVHTGMRAYRRELLTRFPFGQVGTSLAVELQVGPTCAGYRCTELFIDYQPRIGDSKLQRWYGTVWTFKRLWKWRWFANPNRKALEICHEK